MPVPQSRRVVSDDGVPIAVYESGSPELPTVLAVHGYPDNAALWDGVAEALTGRCRLIRYDVRGAGRSGAPAGRSGYRLPQLAADARAVLDATAPEGRVHLLGHDWGSVQGWYFVTEPRLAPRLASFTSVSGPAVTQLGPWLRNRLRSRRPGPALWQLAHSSYIAFFQLPVLPELAWRSGLAGRLLGEPAEHRTLSDALNGLELYRANLLGGNHRQAGQIDLPVQVLAPRRDRYLHPELLLEAPRPIARRLRGRVVESGHWLPLSQPELLADAVAEFVAEVEGTG